MSAWNFHFFALTKHGVENAVDAMMKAKPLPMPTAVGHLIKEAASAYPADDDHSGYFVSSAGSFESDTGAEVDRLQVTRTEIVD